MSTKNMENSDESDNLCVVCFKNVEIYSIGACDHAVCFECSTRMRILCKQNECPICRRELPKVLFTSKPELFSVMFPKFERSNLQDRKFGIIFTTMDIQKAYFKLLEHRCQICEKSEHNWPFKTFVQLKDHMRREHELFFCDICSEHLKIFSFERKCYDRKELGYHRRKGDKNNSSHRGHPLCEFCDIRFMDNDELFRHLRRNHLFCHFCDTDGKHQYYNTVEHLKDHFREEHFLCEEGECKTNPLTAVFRTDIDLKAHAVAHSKNMSKSATRQARTLELEFTMAPRARNDNVRNRRPVDRRDRFEDDALYSVEPGGSGGSPVTQPQLFINPLTSDHFPALGGSSTNNNSNNITLVSKNYTKFSNAAFNSNDFPSLGGRTAPAVTITTNSAAGAVAPEVTITRTVRSQQSAQKQQKENFPALGGNNNNNNSNQPGSSTVRLSVNSNNQQQPPKVSIQVNQKSNGAITTHITTSSPSTSAKRSDFFPALSKSDEAKSVKQPQWVQPKPKKQEEPKSSKVAACPSLETGDFQSFPTLSKGKAERPKKTSSVTVPVDSWVNLNSMKSTYKNGNRRSEPKVEKSVERVEKNSKGKGDNSPGPSNNKRADTKKTSSSKTASNFNNDLKAKLDQLKFVEVKKSEEDGKKTKKKKNKIVDSNSDDIDNNEDNKEKRISEWLNKAESSDVNHNEEVLTKNGMTKKRSELKIGSLSNSSGSLIASNNHFPLSDSRRPPPGFSNRPQTTVKPPPGFSNTNFPSLSVSNDLTFTNSSGQSYSISPTQSQALYKQPQNFQNRNQNLIKRFMEILNNNDSIVEFKTVSDNYRKGDLEAEKYYESCRSILGDSFEDTFPELLVLLPDIQKQQELYKCMGGNSKNKLIACENCKQIIFKHELSEHYNYHKLENEFPSLGSAQPISSAWRK